MSLLPRKLRYYCAPALVIFASCGNADWNWDASWWKKPRRIVKPQPANRGPEQPRTAEAAPVNVPVNDRAPEVPSASSSSEHRSVPTGATRAFHQLYLVSGPKKTSPDRGDFQARINGASAHAAASLIEQLYVPVGRSGSREDCYLLYENRDEFNAAAGFVRLLIGETSPGLSSRLEQPVIKYYRLIERGPVVDKSVVDDCALAWSKAAFSDLPELQRWAAAIISGKLLADYQYDYPRARDSYQRAAQSMPDGSIEQMSALFWQAEAFALEGRRDEAIGTYEKILSVYGEHAENTQIVRRAEASIDKLKRH